MTPSDAQSIANLALVMSLVSFFVAIVYYVWYALALSKLFPKLGAESWRGWVPVLNEMEILVRGGVPGWSVVYYFIPIVSLYGLYLKATAVHRINVQLGKGIGMTVLGILLPPVWASLLGWGHTAAVPGVYHKRVESMLGGAPAPAPAASGPLAEQPTAFSPPPFTPAPAADASGYALPTPPAPPAPPASFAAPPAPAVSFAAPTPPAVSPPAPAPIAQPAPPAAGSIPAAPAAADGGMIQNPWAQQAPAATPVSPPPTVSAPPAPSVIAPPPGLPQPTAPEPIVSTPPSFAEAPAVAAAPPVAPPAAPPVVPVVPPVVAADPPVIPVEDAPVDVAPVEAASVEAAPAEPAPVEPEPVAPQVAPPVAPPVVGSAPAAAPPVPVTAAATSEDPDDDDDDELDRTVVVDRRPVVPWTLHTDDGFSVALTASKIVLGRNPASKELDVEAVAIPDTTRTLSKTHARLDLVDGAWTVTDLHSTNGVIVVGADDTENLIAVGEATPLLARFVLGKVGMRVSFEDEPSS